MADYPRRHSGAFARPVDTGWLMGDTGWLMGDTNDLSCPDAAAQFR
jgi:hypothetical protein